jgi:hypothetical protein
MAFQISSSVPNEGNDALNALLQKENMERGMRMQGFGTFLNSQTANRELDIQEARTAEQANLERLRMLQSGYQFDQSMQAERDALNFRINDAAAARQHDIDLQTSSQDFQTQQDTSFRLWQESQLQKVHANQLEIEKLRADAEAAYDAKSYQEAQAITQRIKDLQIKSSTLSAKVSEAQALVGQTAGARDKVRNGMSDNITRMIDQYNQAAALGGNQVNDVTNLYTVASLENAKANWATLDKPWAGNPFSADVSDISMGIANNDTSLSGSRFLKFWHLGDYGFSRVIGAGDFTRTADGRLIATDHEMTKEQMEKVIRGDLTESVMKSMVGWRIPNMNADAARQLVDGLIDGKSQSEIVQLAQTANVPLPALGILFEKLSQSTGFSLDPQTPYATTQAARLEELARNKGQISIRSESLRKSLEELDIVSRIARRASNAVPGMNTDQLKAALDHFKRGVETGLIDDATTKELQDLGLGKSVTDLASLMEQVKAQEAGHMAAMREQGKTAEELKSAQAELPLVEMRGRQAGSSTSAQTLQGLLDAANAEALRRREEAMKYDQEVRERRKARR